MGRFIKKTFTYNGQLLNVSNLTDYFKYLSSLRILPKPELEHNTWIFTYYNGDNNCLLGIKYTKEGKWQLICNELELWVEQFSYLENLFVKYSCYEDFDFVYESEYIEDVLEPIVFNYMAEYQINRIMLGSSKHIPSLVRNDIYNVSIL